MLRFEVIFAPLGALNGETALLAEANLSTFHIAVHLNQVSINVKFIASFIFNSNVDDYMT